MPELDGDEASFVFEVVAVELGAEQEGVGLSPAMLGLDKAQQAFDPRCGRLPTTKTPVHRQSVVAVGPSDKPDGRSRSPKGRTPGDQP